MLTGAGDYAVWAASECRCVVVGCYGTLLFRTADAGVGDGSSS